MDLLWSSTCIAQLPSTYWPLPSCLLTVSNQACGGIFDRLLPQHWMAQQLGRPVKGGALRWLTMPAAAHSLPLCRRMLPSAMWSTLSEKLPKAPSQPGRLRPGLGYDTACASSKALTSVCAMPLHLCVGCLRHWLPSHTLES